MTGASALWDRAVLLVGGSGPDGQATAIRLLQCHAQVALLARNPDRLRQAREAALAAAGPAAAGRVLTVAADVREPAAVQAAVEAVRCTWGRLDALVYNVGGGSRGRVADQPVDAFRDDMELNFYGLLHCVKATLPLLVASGRGHVVMVSGHLARNLDQAYPTYAASKAAAFALLRVLAREHAPAGLACTTVFLGRRGARWLNPAEVAAGIAGALAARPASWDVGEFA